ncbi:MAG TPA: hypothetical protein VFA65_08245, partial [Bryobacteraceae bacterium]|nr:hypothetical protein [Bryobacteraceae bacterium]
DEFRKKVCAALERLATMLEEQSEYAAAIPYAEPLVATEGYSAAEVGQTYERALELSRQLDNRNIFAIFSGVWVFHTVRGDLEKARQTSLEFLKEAEREPTPGLMLTGNFLLGSNLFHLGELEKSLAHLNAAMREHKGTLEPVLALFAGPDIEFFCRSYLCHIAWHRGDGNCGRDHVENAIAGARALRRPFSEAIALNYAAMLHAFEDETRAALERGREAVELCRRHGFTYYLAMANVLTGWAAAAQGEVEIGLAQLREGLDSLRRLGAELRLPYYFALLAETLARTGLAGEARASLSNGFAFASKNGEQWTLAELYRVQGNLLAAEEKMEAASASFQKGLEAARQCGSLAFEKKLSILVAGTRENYFPERF